MSKINPTKHKHLTLNDRLDIQQYLNNGLTFKSIAQELNKSASTISKEVKKHMVLKAPNLHYSMIGSDVRINKDCPRLLKAPYVCNPCEKRHKNCIFQKRLYEGKVAHKEYTTLLSEAREGIPLNKEEFYMIDRVLSQAIKRGQHLYHIMKSNNLSISKSTAYRHLHRGYLSVSKLDFPRVVKFKVRKQAPGDYIPKATKIGRTYKDFLTYLNENNIQSFVEMDTVIGRIGGKTILTLNFNNCNFIIGILLDSKSSKSVTEKIQELKANLTKHSVQFGDLFRIILTDNGGEFANVTAFENALDGTLESNVFFCDPFQSSQKPRVEKNHTLFRDIVPKGSSFDNFTQETVNLIFSHVNCVKRKNLQGRSAYDIFVFLYGKYIANLLGISEIPADKVIQSPKLLKK